MPMGASEVIHHVFACIAESNHGLDVEFGH